MSSPSPTPTLAAENTVNSGNQELTIIAAVAVIVVIVVSITLATYYKKHQRRAKKLDEPAENNVP